MRVDALAVLVLLFNLQLVHEARYKTQKMKRYLRLLQLFVLMYFSESVPETSCENIGCISMLVQNQPEGRLMDAEEGKYMLYYSAGYISVLKLA